MSSLAELTERVRAFVAERDWEQFHSPRNLAMALSVEAGELLELFLWTRDEAQIPPSRRTEVEDEAADVLMCLLNFCDRAEIDLEKALVAKLAKAAAKYPASQVRGKALKYDQYPGWNAARHRLEVGAPGLAHEDAMFLIEQGVPAELRLPGWAGPTLFTSEIGSGRMRAGDDGSLVLGSIRETEGAPAILGEFVIKGREVLLVDLPELRVRGVNSYVREFVTSIETFHRAFTAAQGTVGVEVLDAVRSIDPAAFDDPDGYWAMWVEELLGG